MRSRELAFALAVAVATWLLPPAAAHAELKVATLHVTGMVCQA